MIYVQIASYKDPELEKTVHDLMDKAYYKDDIRICICLQDTPEELDRLKRTLPQNITIIDVPWNESKGLCWARSLIQENYNYEEYTLQIDSHHRFTEHWDKKLIDMHSNANNYKSIFSSYATPYDPMDDTNLRLCAYKMRPTRFTDYGTIMFVPHIINDWQNLDSPIPARFVSGHFFFTVGEHCIDYKYDPNIYFAGDEISLSIRSYTLGYDLYHPHIPLVWHEYTRANRVKHWDDHTSNNKNEKMIEHAWHETNSAGLKRLRHMLKEEDNHIDLGAYGLGPIRTHTQYEKYAGIDFRNRLLHRDAVDGIDPPSSENGKFVPSYFRQIHIPKSISDMNSNDDIQFVYTALETENNSVAQRRDYVPGKIPNRIDFISYEDSPPKKVVIWPYSKTRKWLDRIDISVK